MTGEGKCQSMGGLEQTRLQVLNRVLEHQVTVDEAAQVLAVTECHLWRILAAYRKEGAPRWPMGIGIVGQAML